MRGVCGRAACGLLHRWGPGQGCVGTQGQEHSRGGSWWSVGHAAERACHCAALTPARPHPSHQPGLLYPGCWVSLGMCHHHVPLCTPSCNRQRRSSERWMRPSPCSRRCCDPQFQPSAPGVPPTGMATIKYFANIFCCLCGVGRACRGLAWEFPGAAGGAGSSQALGPGGQRDASVWVCLWHGARPESCCSAASSLPTQLTSLHCAVATEARPGPALPFATSCGPGLARMEDGQGLPVLNPLARSLSLSCTEAQLIITLT